METGAAVPYSGNPNLNASREPGHNFKVMKKFILCLLAVAAGMSAFGQGRVMGVRAGLNVTSIDLGPFVGAVAGELLNDRGDFPKAILVGFGSFLSFIVGTGLKVVAAVGMLIHVTADTYPAIRDWFATLF